MTLANLVQELKTTKHNDIPALVLSSKQLLLDNTLDLWRHETIRSRILGCLTFDYVKVLNGWNLATNTADLAVNILLKSSLLRPEQLTDDVLRTFSADFGTFLRIFVAEWIVALSKDTKSVLLDAFNKNCETASKFYTRFPHCTTNLVESEHFFGLLTALPPIALTFERPILTLLSFLSRLNGNTVCVRDFRKRRKIIDTLARTISDSNDLQVAKYAVGILNATFASNPLELENFRKHWNRFVAKLKLRLGFGFDAEVSTLKRHLDTGAPETRHLMEANKAAQQIQALWRGYHTRKRLAKMKAGFVTLQRRFRRQRLATMDQKKIQLQTELEKLNVQSTTLKRSRKYQEKKYRVIAGLHPNLVDNFLKEEADVWATIIQAWFRGNSTRRQLQKQRQGLRFHKAAVVIQRTMQSWYRQRLSMKQRLFEWPELTEERREELQQHIDRENEMFKAKSRDHLPSVEHQRRLHDSVQQMLVEHWSNRTNELRAFQKRDVLLARLQADMGLLEEAPKLSEMADEQLYQYRSDSGAVANAALRLHRQLLREMTEPWWKNLGGADRTNY